LRTGIRRVLTVEIIQSWLRVRGTDTKHVIAALADPDPRVAAAWEHSLTIDDLIGSAKVVLNGLASKQFETELRERIAHETEGPSAAEAIWQAAKAESPTKGEA